MINIKLEAKDTERSIAVKNELKISGTLYLKGKVNRKSIEVNQRDFKYKYERPGEIYEVEFEGNSFIAKVISIKRDPESGKLVYFSMQQLSRFEPININVPINFEGKSPGLLKGGMIFKVKEMAEVTGNAKEIPYYLKADISEMEIGDILTIGDLNSSQVAINCDDSEIIAICRPPVVSIKLQLSNYHGDSNYRLKRKSA